jgi:hypothetical protein
MKQDIIISINEPPRPEDKRRKGIIRPSLRSKYFARRLQSNDIYLKVFDGGQLVGGSDIAFFGRSTTTTSSFTLNVGGLYGQMVYISDFPQSNTFNTDFFSIDEDSWVSTYEEITDVIADYDLDLPGFGSYVSGQGLIKEEGTTAIESSGTGAYFWDWDMANTSDYKITATQTYSDPSVSFTFDRDCDLFITPRLYGTSGDARISLTFPMTHYAVHGLMKAMPRNGTLNNAAWAAFWANRGTPLAHTQASRDKFHSISVGNADCTMFTMTVNGYGAVPSGDVSEGGAGGFPSQVSGTFSVLPSIAQVVHHLWEGTIVAAIRKHLPGGAFEWYYVWNRAFQFMSSSPASIPVTIV